MSGTADKIKGEANEAIGKVKQHAGDALGSDTLKRDGVAQEVKGHDQKMIPGEMKEQAIRETAAGKL